MSSSGSSDQEYKEEVTEKTEEEDKPDSTSQNIEKDDDSSEELHIKSSNNNNEADAKPEAEEENEEEEGVGLLDRPVEVFGCRERKQVQRLEISFNTPSKEKAEIPEGKGNKLGDCPRIEFHIQKTLADDLKILHRLLFGRMGSATEIKRNIRKFSGFTFPKGSVDFEKKKASLEKIKMVALKHICEVLDLERGGSKEDIVNRISEFLLEPKDSGKKVPKPKKKGAKGVKRKRGEKKKSTDKSKLGSSSENEEEDSGNSEKVASDDDDDKEEDEEEEKEEEEEEPKKKKAKATKKAPPKPKKEPVKKGRKTPAKKSKKEKESSDDSDSDDDDVPLVKSSKNPPTNDEIKTLVKKILKTADLQQITMKKVIQQVYDHFPDFDLSNKKDFIKSTVKAVIS